ncbi:hypothetical protein CJJ23_01680 [Mycoplasmopsis agassizii]|uniref:Integrase catalytic domain-containing protein n=1 Tax=Mycoplasmopsis agassizii TaxID=33922 RepID=A0A269TJ57_9BACT|nr:IS30 family transposase [Mycoplasmopsis agassizii]PAK21484.1 hypothetical protein CJJ23_01680 [Mycoplasmopsis agassizii]
MLYKRLGIQERFAIQILLREGNNITEISRKLDKDKSTISREIRINSSHGEYDSAKAEQKANERKHKNFQTFEGKYKVFAKYLIDNYKPETKSIKVIIHSFKDKQPNEPVPCWKTVYNWANSGNWFIKRDNLLRNEYKHRKKPKISYYSKFKHLWVLPIWLRPDYINDRRKFGHWEIDLIIGKKDSNSKNLMNLTERLSRKSFVIHVDSKKPQEINEKLSILINEENLFVKSITVDNGLEFSKLNEVVQELKIMIYYCGPYASFQRGSNENWNGLIRRFYKKGTDFSFVSKNELKIVEDEINSMPREILGWKSSNKVYDYYMNLMK